MGLFISTFVILMAVAISNIISRYIPGISSTYINLGVGIIAGLIPWTNHAILSFENEVFMILILAPLLFFEGQLTPLFAVRKRLKGIIGTAVILAIVSAVVVAVVVGNLMGLAIPLALIIVAISTPTDATAFDSVIEGRKVGQSMKKTLKMESLFNDATGIILLQAAVIWLSTGHLSFWQNTSAFLFSAIGGVVLGALMSLALIAFRQFFVRSANNVISSQTLIYLLTPFFIYFVSEEIGVSGIIAVVTAGLVHNSEANRSRFSSPRQMHLGIQLVNFVSEALNGAVFVILGISLERIFSAQFDTLTNSPKWLIVGILVYLLLLIFRYGYARLFVGRKTAQSALAFALGGVHGTVTLAMTFSISGEVSTTLFNFVLLVETVVIILSMLVPTLAFKLLLPIDVDAENHEKLLQQLRQEMVEAGIQHVKTLSLSPIVKNSVIYDLRDQVGRNTLGSFFRQWHSVTANKEVLTSLQSVEQRRALMQAFDAERSYLYDLAKRHVMSSELIYEVYSEILLSESLVLDPANQMI